MSFGSDNHSGAHPAVLAAVADANAGHTHSYGDDDVTRELETLARRLFGEQAQVWPTFTGTGANVLALAALTRPYDAVITTETAHINVDECAAPEKLAGVKLLTVATPDGKLTPELAETRAVGFGDEHHAQPRVVSITQSTELGTLYTVKELRAVTDWAHAHDMLVHLDGARLANACAALGVEPRAVTTEVGIDVLSWGCTKNGGLGAEAVVVLDPDAVSGMKFHRKQQAQLASKMRFLSAQILALWGGDLWRENADHANAMAVRLADALSAVDGVGIAQDPQVNAVFARIAPDVARVLREKWFFYDWDTATHEVRWMCSWDTSEAEVDEFVADVKAAVR